MNLRLKICGLKDPGNVKLAETIDPDYMGFIFYPGSPRFAGKYTGWINHLKVPEKTVKVGVFVNTAENQILRLCNNAGINIVQLHGRETVEQCRKLKESGLKVIKVFSVGPGFKFNVMDPYSEIVDYFLFDTRSEFLGGSGIPFDWDLIRSYPFDIPFFLSGGIGPENVMNIKHMDHEHLFGIDVNSRLESAPGIKEINKLKDFKIKFDGLRL